MFFLYYFTCKSCDFFIHLYIYPPIFKWVFISHDCQHHWNTRAYKKEYCIFTTFSPLIPRHWFLRLSGLSYLFRQFPDKWALHPSMAFFSRILFFSFSFTTDCIDRKWRVDVSRWLNSLALSPLYVSTWRVELTNGRTANSLAPLTTLRYSGGEMANEWPGDERIGWRVVCRENVSQVGWRRGERKKQIISIRIGQWGGLWPEAMNCTTDWQHSLSSRENVCYLLRSLEIHRASSAIYISIHHSGIDTLFNTKYCGKW